MLLEILKDCMKNLLLLELIVLTKQYRVFRASTQYIRISSTYDWRTCLWATYLYPEIIIESLVFVNSWWKNQILSQPSSDYFENLIKTTESLKEKDKTSTLIYNKWTKVPNPLLPKGTTRSRKMSYIYAKIWSRVKGHLHHAHIQFKAFKTAWEEVSTASVLIVHIDWSKYAKLRPAKEFPSIACICGIKMKGCQLLPCQTVLSITHCCYG